ncbi:MAG: signal recognition particle-docking protein FtsY [Gammaproteobacteria bacterium]|nr:signal recognition particle-docking protein FtsY [Gammaproteobacteria bacterium]
MFGKNKASGDENAAEAVKETKKPGFVKRLRARLNQGDSWLTMDVADLIPGGKIDELTLEELETRLLTGDVGIDATEKIIGNLESKLRRTELKDLQALGQALRSELREILEPVSKPLQVDSSRKPYVILMVGVNGAGKTTTIGKLSRRFLDQGHSVMLAAGDTFRAAAVEQLQTWGQRNDVPVIAQQPGADPAAVVYDALEAAKARGIDVLIADTAGRLHTQDNLMDELRKVKRVLSRLDEQAPDETMLIIDAGNGQNALVQAQQFHEAIGLTGLTITKLDGTAKGGILVAIAQQLQIPIRFIGVGEQAADLGVFSADDYVDALLSSNTE